MGLGIGAGGYLGIAFEVLPPPVQTAGAQGVGGGLADGAYKFYVTALNANGETTVSNEITVTVAAGGGTASIDVNWTAVTGATSYKIYATAMGGASGTQLFVGTVSAPTVTFNYTGTPAPSGAFPTANTAYNAGVYTSTGMKFVPFLDESITQMEETVNRRPIRESADVIGAVAGNEHVEGDINMEALEDCLVYFLGISRSTIVKTGSAPNYTYTQVPTAAAVPVRTATILIKRADEIFAYVGCVVSSFKFGIQDGMLTFSCSIIGRSEATQSAPVTSYPTTAPFGAGTYSVEFPTGSAVTDTDTFEWTCEDNGEAQFRLKNTGRGADFVKYGERDLTMTAARDFTDKTQYAAFKAVTTQSVTITASKGANNSVSLLTPVTYAETYEVGLSGQGDLVRANIGYRSMLGSPGAYQIVVKTQENLAI